MVFFLLPRAEAAFFNRQDCNKADGAWAASRRQQQMGKLLFAFVDLREDGGSTREWETAKVIPILSAGCIDSDHQSPAHTSLTPAFRGRPKVTLGHRI